MSVEVLNGHPSDLRRAGHEEAGCTVFFCEHQHTGAVHADLYISDVDAVPPQTPSRKPGPVYVPYNGSIDLLYTSSVALSFEQGNLRGFIGTGAISVAFGFGTEFSSASAQVYRQPFVVSPGNTISETMWLPSPFRILGLQCYLFSAALTAGSYQLSLSVGAQDLLDPVLLDLTGVVPMVVTDVSLVSNPSLLEIPANTPLTFSVTSNNGDLICDGLIVQLLYGWR